MLYSFLSFIKHLYELLVVWQLNQYFVLLSDNIFYIIKKIITLINNPTDSKTYLKLLAELISLFGYLFYLEIFEIKCCGLNKDTKDNITKRGIKDTNSNILLDGDNEIESINNDNYNENYENSQKSEMINLGE